MIHAFCLLKLIMNAEIDAAIAQLKDRYPQLIEKGSIEEAKSLGNQDFKDFKDSGLLENLFDDCSALLECKNVEESGAAYLLGETQKQIVAAAVNETILSTNPVNTDQRSSSLERFLRQFEATGSLYAHNHQEAQQSLNGL
ncbi:CRA domain [Arabidopsis suecica]|uniref:CRA domain n=1 Tax=Arabidopsis suecica TaxID=45249 RepID=A0A8T1ZF42_ARASU|nr:CRA domain [Arabidopsis suecica]